MSAPRSAGQSVEEKRARSALFVNLAVLPGLGTLACRLWVEGIGQLALALIGFVLICVWFYGMITAVFVTLTVPLDGGPQAGAGLMGLALSFLAWVWSGLTGYRLRRDAGAGPR